MNFECHITVSVEHADIAKRVAERNRWKTSEIARDPLLGDGTYFYLTRHSDLYERVLTDMNMTVEDLRREQIPVIRRKIELIMLDSKTGVGL